MDLNADGNIDLLTASFSGYSYVFYGNDNGSFKTSEIIVDKNGGKIRFGLYHDLEIKKWIYEAREAAKSENLTAEEKEKYLQMDDNCVMIKAVDWDNDGDMDLVLSGRKIGAKLCLNEGSKTELGFSTEFIPVITTKGYMANAMIDWDGDGLFDILSSSKAGGVYFYKNYGKLGLPEFNKAGCLIDSSALIAGEYGGECGLTLISATDYNNDGKLDLIIGSKNTLIIPAPKLTDDQVVERDQLILEKEKASKKLTVFFDFFKAEYGKDKAKIMEARKNNTDYQKARGEYSSLSKKLRKLTAGKKTHGYVWVSLRK